MWATFRWSQVTHLCSLGGGLGINCTQLQVLQSMEEPVQVCIAGGEREWDGGNWEKRELE